MGSMGCRWVIGFGLLAVSCTAYSHTNVRLKENREPNPHPRATFDVSEPRGKENVLVMLALSGGGSRAAYFATEMMFEMEDVLGVNLLDEVDVISSVSGGSIAAAYFCITADEDAEKAPSGRRWNRDSARDQMSKNYQMRWIGNWFWPWNIGRYWFTAYDRADIMAKTFSDNLYDSRLFGWELTFEDLNPERPYLIINSTDATQHKREELHFGEVFTFTTEDFTDKLGSDIEQYSIGRAVMASACFPSAFSYMTLRDYRQKKREYVHVFDGGNADNLGLASLTRLIMQLEDGPPEQRPDRYVVISIDAFTDPPGVDRHSADPRMLLDYLVDTNFLGSVDALLQMNRNHVLNQFKTGQLDVGQRYEVVLSETEEGEILYDYVETTPEVRHIENLTFWHVRFRDISNKSLRKGLNDIPTSLNLSDDNAHRIERAAKRLVAGDASDALKQVLDALGHQP